MTGIKRSNEDIIRHIFHLHHVLNGATTRTDDEAQELGCEVRRGGKVTWKKQLDTVAPPTRLESSSFNPAIHTFESYAGPAPPSQ